MPSNPLDDYWEEVEGFPVSDWQYEVANDETRQSYHEWVEKKKGEKDAENK